MKVFEVVQWADDAYSFSGMSPSNNWLFEVTPSIDSLQRHCEMTVSEAIDLQDRKTTKRPTGYQGHYYTMTEITVIGPND